VNGFCEKTDSPNSRNPTYLFGAWPAIRARLSLAANCAIFLDFDGTLVELSEHAHEVEVPAEVSRVLRDLAQFPHIQVTIVSGRNRATLRKLLRVTGIHYIGLHGGEMDGNSPRVALSAQAALSSARREVRKQLASLPGLWLEDKGLGFSIHYRAAREDVVRSALAVLPRLLKTWDDSLHVLSGRLTWEVLPRDIPGKFAAVKKVMTRFPRGTPAVYAGDDDTDEPAFSVLRKQVTVRVRPDGRTRAAYFVRAPAEVLDMLERIVREVC